MKQKIKEALMDYMPEFIEDFLRYTQSLTASEDYFKGVDRNEKKIVIMLAADYGNLGDIAITQAQRDFLYENFPDYRIIEIPIGSTYKSLPSLRKIVGVEDIITTTGGGFMGSLYYGAEKKRCYIIKKFPNNRIISFPQTIFFENNIKGKIAKRRMARIYNGHNDLTLLARDRQSFDIMKGTFKNNSVYLTPDIALYLDSPRIAAPSSELPIGLCLRDDKEIGDSQSKLSFIKQFFVDRGDSVVKFDTHIGDVTISQRDRMVELGKNWEQFKSCKLVVTDRLHGMIFCAITRTPCIAINNANGKVKHVYDSWLRKIGGVAFLGSVGEDGIKKALEELFVSTPKGTVVLAGDFKDMWQNIQKGGQ